jgi:hypothetical protein
MEDEEAPPRGVAHRRARTITRILMILLIGMIVRDIIVRQVRARRQRGRTRRDIAFILR